jgi:Putative transmembrane protein (Alph_Pro_TM)
MKHHGTINKVLVIFPVLILSALFLFMNTASAQLTAKANHDHIKVDFFYHGSTVSVRGISDPDTDLIIKITSDDRHETLREKGKVGGFLWMNVGELQIENVPNVYFLHSTKNIEDILSQDEMNKYVIGYPALAHHITMNVPEEAQKMKWFREFVKFKESSNLYATTTGNISLTDDNGSQKYYILTQWPYQALPANYTVTVYAVKNHKVVETATSGVLVEQAGMVKSFSTMAKNNAAEYGIISILAALGAGLGVGLVFRKSGGAH